MKKILGLDIGVNSVGFALISKDEDPSKSEIIKTGVRIVNEDPDFHGNFYQGNSASKNESRRTKRSIRRNNQRFKARRDQLYRVLRRNGMFPTEEMLLEISEFELYKLRSLAVTERISPEELGRVLIHMNQRRGYKSNRKANITEEEGGYLGRIAELAEFTTNITVGQFWYYFLKFKRGEISDIPFNLMEWFTSKLSDQKDFRIRENIFLRDSYLAEFDLIWLEQQKYYPTLLTGKVGNTFKENRNSLYQLLRNEIIFFQRKLKSQKHLISDCPFENRHKAAPKSSPLFQSFRIWQQLNNLEVTDSLGNQQLISSKQRLLVYNALHDASFLTAKCTLAYSKALKLMGFGRDFHLNYPLLEGNKTWFVLYNAFVKAKVSKPDEFLEFDSLNPDLNYGLYDLWHITYSLENDDDIINVLQKRYRLTFDQAECVAQNVGYTSDYGSLSSRAIRKLLPHLIEGKNYYEACIGEGYYNPEHLKREEFKIHMDKIFPNSLRNPVVEQVLNQVSNVVNSIIDNYGNPDEVRVELARELKNNARKRKEMTQRNRNLRKLNDTIALRLKDDYGFSRINSLDLQRYRLWDETEKRCLYCGSNISITQLYNGEAEIEHIIPWSRSFNDSFNNKIIAHRKCNKDKDQMTAFDFMETKGEFELKRYTDTVDRLFNDGSGRLDSEKKIRIPFAKRQNLLIKGSDIKGDFLTRQLKDTQYIVMETVSRLKEVFPVVTTTTGTVTDYLREKWELKNLIQELNLDKFKEAGLTEFVTVKDNGSFEKQIERIKDWTKRDDHRHHAVDALIVSLTSQGMIQRINNLNQEYEKYREMKEKAIDFPCPIKNLRYQARESIGQILISFKKPGSKVLTRKMNRIKTNKGIVTQTTWVPRGSLHEDTVFGMIKWYQKIPLNRKFSPELVGSIADPYIRGIISERMNLFGNDPKKAFTEPLVVKDKVIEEVTVFNSKFTKRVLLSENITEAQVSKIIDPLSRKLIEERIRTMGGLKPAFREYLSNPIWQNKEKGIMMRHVTVFDEGRLESVRDGHVYTKGNHHALVYIDEKGKYVDRIVTFWEAVENCLINLREKGSIYPIIDRRDPDGLKFLFSMQINDLFVFDINPEDVNFFDPANRNLISQKLFRVQKMSRGDYWFRHHLETTIASNESFSYKRVVANSLNSAVKVKLNNLGEIIGIGE